MRRIATTLTSLALLGLGAHGAAAQEYCEEVTLSDVGWTDITATTAVARTVLEALGYEVDVKVLSVPVTFASLAGDDVDVFLGNWMPTQEEAIREYEKNGEIEAVGTNLTGTKYTLAVPAYTWEKGLQSYADLAEFEDELDGRIYGIEPGNVGNAYLISLTEEEGSGLTGFTVVESSEQGMLAQVDRAVRRGEDVVFLGWEPHPMNTRFDLRYLPGGEAFFGGEGIVRTVTRAGFSEACPNVGEFLQNLEFSLDMENELMGLLLDEGMDPGEAAESWLSENPETLEPWLEGVETVEGEPGLPAVTESLGL